MQKNHKESRLENLIKIVSSKKSGLLSSKSLNSLLKKVTCASKFWRKAASACLLLAPRDKTSGLLETKKVGKFLVKSIHDFPSHLVTELEQILVDKSKQLSSMDDFIFFLPLNQPNSQDLQALKISTLADFSLKESLNKLPDPQKFQSFTVEIVDICFENKNEVKIGDLNWEADQMRIKKFKKQIDTVMKSEYGEQKNEAEEISINVSTGSSSPNRKNKSLMGKSAFKEAIKKMVIKSTHASPDRSRKFGRRLRSKESSVSRGFRITTSSSNNKRGKSDRSIFRSRTRDTSKRRRRKINTFVRMTTKNKRRCLFSQKKIQRRDNIFEQILVGEQNSILDTSGCYARSSMNFFKGKSKLLKAKTKA